MLDPSSWRHENNERQWYKPALFLLNEEKTNKKRLLELGSGLGEFGQILAASTKAKITLTDGSKQYVKELIRKGFVAKAANFNQKLPFKNNEFDIVISLEVVEHIEKAELFLLEINRVLKDKGVLIISTPNFAWWGYRLRYLIGNPPKVEGYHIRHFTYFTLRNLLVRSGFKIIKTNSFTPVPLVNRLMLKFNLEPLWPSVPRYQNLLAQNLVFKVSKK